uniref:glutathione transferase n=1 Tax=Panagrolaimus davidi TaxID=227884 RepID=A0A914NXE9_9BILA
MPQYKLHYFDIRGMAEPARLIFHFAGQEFEDRRYDRQAEWPKVKPIEDLEDNYLRIPLLTSETGKAPWLDVDNERIYESLALTRYLGRKFNLAGKDEMESAQINSIVDTCKDFFDEVQSYLSVKRGRSEGNLEELRPKYDETCKKWYTYLQSRLDKAKSGFITSKISWGDFLLAEGILTMQNFDEEFTGKYPKIVEYKERVYSHPKIKEYVEKRGDLLY